MISFFPALYPDELIYSLMSRYCITSGHIAYTHVAAELFTSKNVCPDMEFIDAYSPAVLEILTKNIPMEKIVEKHTMFPYYGRFLPKKIRQKAFRSMVFMSNEYRNLLPIPKSRTGEKRHLRYCPVCAKQDREAFGETYWHRIPQMIGIQICPLHGCDLQDSDVVISYRTIPKLIAAENVIPTSDAWETKRNDIRRQIAKYMESVFQANMDMDSDINVGIFLNEKMAFTKYRSQRGEKRNMTQLHTDFTEFYRDFPDDRFKEMWMLKRVFSGSRASFCEICMVAMFLGASADELLHMELPEKSQSQLFDEEIFRLHDQGLSYPEIAKKLNAHYHNVKAIGEHRYKRKALPKGTPRNSMRWDWEQIDATSLPLVREAIERTLDLPRDRIRSYLPQCLAEIQKYEETQEQYWIRKIVWAIHTIRDSGYPLTRNRIMKMTCMRQKEFDACLPVLSSYADSETTSIILSLFWHPSSSISDNTDKDAIAL